MGTTAVLGTAALAFALLAAVATIAIGVVAGRREAVRLTDLSRHGVYLVAGAVVVASACLVHAFVTHDYSIKYVASYSDDQMPLAYLVAAFWGGQAGSLMFWALILCVFSAIAVYTARDRTAALMPWVHVVLMAITVFFLCLLVFVSSPFESSWMQPAATTGSGLNPLLQNYWMAIHPPSLLTGFASFAIPFAFGVAALISGRLGTDWIKLTRRWILISWLFLTIGNILGARWAYEELGWGGYWAWDPVENAAILPWFTATALLHSVMVQEHRGMLKRWNIFLLFLTFWLTIFGTFLTRSGMIQSVHSFAESPIGPVLFGAVIAVAVFGFVMLAWRWKRLRGEHRLESYLSREAAFLANNWVLLAAMFIVIWGTLYPKIEDLISGQDTVVGPPWFNRFAVPIGLALLALMGIGTLIPWRRATKRTFTRNFKPALIWTTVLTAIISALYYVFRLRDLNPNTTLNKTLLVVAALWLAVFCIVIIVVEFARGVRSRRRKTNASPPRALFNLINRHRRRYGGYLVHLGMVFLFFGISGNAFKVSERATLAPNETAELGDYLITFLGEEQFRAEDKLEMYATLEMRQCDRGADGELVMASCGEPTVIRPAKFDYNRDPSVRDPMKITTEVAISMTPLEDVYVSISGGGPGVVAFELHINPFVFWLWLGGAIAVSSTLICLWPEPVRVRHEARMTRLTPAFDSTLMWFLALVPAGLFLFGPDPVLAQPGAPPPAAAEQSATSGLLAEAVGGFEGLDLITPENRAVRPEADLQADSAYLLDHLRCACPTCSGSSMSTCVGRCGHSMADRELIEGWLAKGWTRQEIEQAFVDERGQTTLAIPDEPVKVWLIPVAGILLGILFVIIAARALRKREGQALLPATAGGPSIDSVENDEYQRRLVEELRELD